MIGTEIRIQRARRLRADARKGEHILVRSDETHTDVRGPAIALEVRLDVASRVFLVHTEHRVVIDARGRVAVHVGRAVVSGELRGRPEPGVGRKVAAQAAVAGGIITEGRGIGSR